MIEVVAAMAIFGVGLSGALSSMATLTDLASATRRRGEAVQLAGRLLDDLAALERGDPARSAGHHEGARVDRYGRGSNNDFAIAWDVDDDVPFAGAQRIALEVRYGTRDQRVRLVTHAR